MTTILDGKKLSATILDELKQKLSHEQKKPKLTVILVGENPASQLYVGMKEKKAKEIGMESEVIRYNQDISESILLNKISELNADSVVSAILVQLPLPKHIDSIKVIEAIDPKKDVDGFSPQNIGRISIGAKPYAYPCTPKGIIKLLLEYNIEIEGRHVVIVGRSNIVGKPLAQMFLNKNATVTVCHSKTKNLLEITKNADILVSAVGCHKVITAEMVKANAVVIDVGTSKIDGKVVGDVDFDNVSELTSYITPVPGGVGPMTIACLMENTYELFKLAGDV